MHIDFFQDDCNGCKAEYKEMKGILEVSSLSATEPNNTTQAYKGRTYKEFTEERARKLYGELLIQYLKNSPNEVEAAKKARRMS